MRHVLLASTILSANSIAYGQVVTDGTLGVAQAVIGPDYSITEALGASSGNNLFHSFSALNVNTGENATFSGKASIANVIARSTGGGVTNIDGLVRNAIDGADLHLMNTAGFVFGPNATADLTGDLVITTADFIEHDDSGRFSSSPVGGVVLSAASPTTLGFQNGGNGAIEVNGSVLFQNGGRRILFAGGNIDIGNDPGTGLSTEILALEGAIDLIAINSAGTVQIPSGGSLNQTNLSGLTLGDIKIANGSSITTSNINFPGVNQSGNIFIAGKTVEISQSTLSAESFFSSQAGNIRIVGEDVTINNGSLILARSFQTDSGLTGTDVDIDATNALHFDSAFILTDNLGNGESGQIDLNAPLITGNLFARGNLQFSNSGAVEVSAVISGGGTTAPPDTTTVTKTGAGTLTLSNNNTYVGATNVNNGLMVVNGSIASSSVTVASGATLGGSGITGNTTIQSGGILAPGNSVGTMNTADLNLNAGSTLLIEVTQTAADRVNVTGTVDVTGATLQVNDLAPVLFDTSQTFEIVTNDGMDAVTGTFGSIVDNLGFLSPNVSYVGGTGNDIVLSFTPNSFTTLTGMDENQTSVSNGLDGLGVTSGSPGNDLRNLVTPLPADTARSTFEDLAGEIHVSSVNVLQDISNNFGSQISGRFANLAQSGGVFGLRYDPVQLALGGGLSGENYFATDFAPKTQKSASNISGYTAGFLPDQSKYDVQFWGNLSGYSSNSGEDGNAAGIDSTGFGLIFGADRNISDQTLLGLAVGYGGTQSKIDNGRSELDIDSYTAAFYGTHAFANQLNFDGSLAYGFHSVDGIRRISGIGLTANSDYDAHQFSVHGEFSKRFNWNETTDIIPFVQARYGYLRADSFTETGAGGANLINNGESYSNIDAILGARFETVLENDAKVMIGVGYAHRFGGETNQADYSFVGGGSFSTIGLTREESGAYFETGFEKAFSDSASFFAKGAGTLSSGHQSYSANVGLKIRF